MLRLKGAAFFVVICDLDILELCRSVLCHRQAPGRGNFSGSLFALRRIVSYSEQSYYGQPLIVDNASGLMWLKRGSVEGKTFKEAKQWIDVELNRNKYAGSLYRTKINLF